MDYFFITASVTGCGSPIAPDNGSIEAHQNTTGGAEIFFRCSPGFIPTGRMRAVCGAGGRWNPDPAGLRCISKCSMYFDQLGIHYTIKMGWTRNLKLQVFDTTVMKECCE